MIVFQKLLPSHAGIVMPRSQIQAGQIIITFPFIKRECLIAYATSKNRSIKIEVIVRMGAAFRAKAMNLMVL